MPDENSNSSQPRILIVDDELAIQKFLRSVLLAEDFSTHVADTGKAALSAIAIFKPDLILLDLGLPDVDGVQLIHRIREWSEVPIIVLTVREQDDDKVTALDAGADDYLTKPFSMPELLARVRVALRRTVQQTEPVFNTDLLEVDFTFRRVTLKGVEVQLTPTEYDLLRMLVSHAGRVITHNQILRQLWGVAYVDQPQVLRVNISNLRRKIEVDASRPKYIKTEPGIGYRFCIS